MKTKKEIREYQKAMMKAAEYIMIEDKELLEELSKK